MRRQLQGPRVPFQRKDTPVPLANGGTGKRTPTAAMLALGGIHTSQLGDTPGKLAQLNESGTLPLSVFSAGGSGAAGLSISGPKTLAYGQDAVYYITNLASYTEIPISVSAGGVSRVEDKITITAPSEGDYVDLIIGIRFIRIPLVSAYIEKPTIITVVSSISEGDSLTLQATPFYSEPELFGAPEVITVASVTRALLNPTSSFMIRGRCGEAGTAFAIYDGVTYMLGKGETERVIRRGTDSVVTLGVTGTGTLSVVEAEPLYAHTHTDWRISLTPDFAEVFWGTTVSSGDLTSVVIPGDALPAGDYYISVMYAFREEIQA